MVILLFWKQIWILLKQGRIHGYPSCVQVGRGSDEIDQPSSWAGAVTPKPPVNTKKAKHDGPTDGPTDRQAERDWKVAEISTSLFSIFAVKVCQIRGGKGCELPQNWPKNGNMGLKFTPNLYFGFLSGAGMKLTNQAVGQEQ